MPEDGDGVAFGSFRPADISAVVLELVPRRLQELDRLSRDDGALAAGAGVYLPTISSIPTRISAWRKSSGSRGKRIISATALPWSGGIPISRRTSSISASGTGISGNFWRGRSRRASRGTAFDTSVYVTGETNSGKSYLAETLAFLLAREQNAGVWVLDPHGALARRCAEWGRNLTAALFLFRRQSRGRAAAAL